MTLKDLQHIEQLLVQLHIKVDALIEENQQLKAKLNKSKKMLGFSKYITVLAFIFAKSPALVLRFPLKHCYKGVMAF